MNGIDLNLLVALDALLTEGSVTGAGRRLGLSASAMSRTLTRLRAATGDPLLVRAGRGLVATPRAKELRDRVHELNREVRAVLTPDVARFDMASLEQVFTIRAGEGFVERFSAPLVIAVSQVAPRVRLRFAPKPDKEALPLREGQVDLEIGVAGASAPELRTRFLFRDAFVGAARIGHPLLREPVTPERYAACRHVVASRKGKFVGPVDQALERLQLKRQVVAVVPGFPDALRIARETDLIALVPRSCLNADPTGDGWPASGLVSFELPVQTPEIVVAAMWHPRLDADPAHRWLRETVFAACQATAPRKAQR